MLVLALFALIAGIVTALSPCVLPAIPVVLAGGTGGGRRRPLGIGVGLVVAFTLFTLTLASALAAIGIGADVVRNVAVAVLIAFGVAMLVPFLDDRLSGLFSPLARLGDRLPKRGEGFLGGLVVGGALALVWTPCAGPILAGIAAVAATERVGPAAFLITGAYAVGAAVPLMLLARVGRAGLRRWASRATLLRRGLGAAMIATGAIIFLGLDTRLSAVVLNDVPGYTDTLQAIERSDVVRERLADLRGIDRDAGPRFVEPPDGPSAQPASAGPADDLSELPDAGPAPEIAGISAWFNTDGRALTLASLRGKVVLLDFWTYSCVNCVRTIPHLRELYAAYRDRGLVVIGVHTPEFAFERDPGNVGRAVGDLGVTWPVALDPDYVTWNRYGNQYWPAKYLIDRRGHVRYLHVGEGAYEETEAIVRRVLGPEAAGAPAAARAPDESPAPHGGLTPESYLGHQRIDRFATPEQLVPDRPSRYTAPLRLDEDEMAYDGVLTLGPEDVTAGAGAAVELSFRARKVFLVLGGGERQPRVGRVLVDGRPVAPGAGAGADVGPGGRLAVGGHRLYTLVDLPEGVGRHRLRVELAPGTQAYAFTFGD